MGQRPLPFVQRQVEKLRGSEAYEASATRESFILSPGARVVFTGTMSRPREAWARALADAGFVTGSVTKNCVVLALRTRRASPAKRRQPERTAYLCISGARVLN